MAAAAAAAATKRIRVMTYNVLAEKFATPAKYPHVPSADLLEWRHRLPLLRDEIARSRADVVCLQEIDLEKCAGQFEFEGFAAVVQQSRSRAKDHTWGCAILYRRSKFTLEWQMSRSRAMMVELAFAGEEGEEEDRRRLYVVNVHLEGDPFLPNVRTNQLVSALKHLEKRQLQQRGAGGPGNEATVVCGDFNSRAGETAYELMREGVLEEGATEHGRAATSRTVRHPYSFRSAFAEASGREPRLTYGGHTQCALDFLFVSPALRVVRALCPTPEAERAARKTYLPSATEGSDHLAVAAELELAGR